ncbi:hypothetical protein DFS33DRAFT_1388717 [Desarmillaria ectypa]|nr:hypothetical protein DFS33DRAFT_1388717 [Desarmillaria ectypa]
MGLPLTFYNPYGYSPYGQLNPAMPGQVATPTAPQQAALSVKTESMKEKLLATIQKLVDKGGASSNNRKCGYDRCDMGYRDCTARKADTESSLIKWDYNKWRLTMPDGSDLPKGSGLLKMWIDRWHEEHKKSTFINMISMQAMRTTGIITSLYEKHAEIQAAQLMACVGDLQEEDEDEDPTIKILKQMLQEQIKAKNDAKAQGRKQE